MSSLCKRYQNSTLKREGTLEGWLASKGFSQSALIYKECKLWIRESQILRRLPGLAAVGELTRSYAMCMRLDDPKLSFATSTDPIF